MKEITSLIAVTVAVLLFLGVNCYGGGNEIFGCYQKHGGDLRIVKHPKACRHSEIPISWNKLGPQGPMGPAGPQGPQGLQGPAGPQATPSQGGEYPKVYDAQNQFLGIFPSTYDGVLSFFVPALSKFVSLSAFTGDLDPTYPPVFVFYDGTDCNGNAYADAGMRFQVMMPGSKYIAAEDVGVRTLDFRSVSRIRYDDMGAYRRCENMEGTEPNLLPFKEVSLPFIPPAALPIQFK